MGSEHLNDKRTNSVVVSRGRSSFSVQGTVMRTSAMNTGHSEALIFILELLSEVK